MQPQAISNLGDQRVSNVRQNAILFRALRGRRCIDLYSCSPSSLACGWRLLRIRPQLKSSASWPATDALARKLPLAGEVKEPRANRGRNLLLPVAGRLAEPQPALGWSLRRVANPGDRPRRAEKGRLAAVGTAGHAALLGSIDPRLLPQRRSVDLCCHAHLLSDAGIDTLIFDTTNAETYPAIYTKLCEVFTQIRREGETTPQIAFMVNTQAGETAQKTLSRPVRSRPLPRAVVSVARQTAVDLRSERSVARRWRRSSRFAVPLAVRAGEHAPGLALGSDLSAALRIRRPAGLPPSR